jgi:DNA-binding response OmpR family regulator
MPSRAPSFARPVALIVEGDDAIREMLVDIVRDRGWEAWPIERAHVAEFARALQPQLLLIELWENDPSAIMAAVRELASASWGEELHVVFTSTDHMLLDELQFLLQHARFGVLAKPFDYDELLACLPVPQAHAALPGSLERALGA